MKRLNVRRAFYCALLMLVLGRSAYASSYFYEPEIYEDELQLCIDLLRPLIGAGIGDRVTYQVTDIDFRGRWYRFAINATKVADTGDVEIDGFEVGCKADRRVKSARLLKRPNQQELPIAKELLASK